MTEVGVRELRDHLSAYLKRVRAGEHLFITDRGKPIAILGPVDAPQISPEMQALLNHGVVTWSGGKPRGAKNPPRVCGRTVAETLVEDRR